LRERANSLALAQIHFIYRHVKQPEAKKGSDMPVSYAVSAGLPAPAVHVIHENPDWTAPLFAALESRGIPYSDWNLGSGELAAFETAPQGVFYNRMSASSHTRGNRYARK
jgi:hypothetical protein